MYATFVSEFNFLRHSVICAFRLEDIDRLFDRSDYVALDAERHRWVRRKRVRKRVPWSMHSIRCLGRKDSEDWPVREQLATHFRGRGIDASEVSSVRGRGSQRLRQSSRHSPRQRPLQPDCGARGRRDPRGSS